MSGEPGNDPRKAMHALSNLLFGSRREIKPDAIRSASVRIKWHTRQNGDFLPYSFIENPSGGDILRQRGEQEHAPFRTGVVDTRHKFVEKIAHQPALAGIYSYEDDAFGELFFDARSRFPVKKYLPDQTVISGSFSKIVAPGMLSLIHI